MKEIIYLDTGILHSYIAQHNDGLPTATSNERGEEIQDTNEEANGFQSRTSFEAKLKSGKFEIPVLLKTPEGEFKVVIQPGKFATEKSVMTQIESGKEIISKQLHDNALEAFVTQLEDEGKMHEIASGEMEGKMVKVKSNFKIIDFKYLKKIIQPQTLIDFMFMQTDKEMQSLIKEIDSTPNKQERTRQKALINQEQSKMDKIKKDKKEEFEKIEKSINYLIDILPMESFIVIGNAIAPLKNEYLREKANELMFKYGGASSSLTVTLVGKVTKKITDTNMPEFNKDPFFEIPAILNSVLSPLGIIKKGDLIISPIAIYFE
ncbi:hypothetical protein JOC86_002341 [Bacillus pakistanensis]|uniref:Uncharacterized protein n=1 Tax=Rossellomorea pakistanensis TaxID=992288 RepID=A0ABS2NDH6_9BACI|nr:hypothetical protein [Bacillus pakistanensis]MBM7585799.1 hypothetical protein [Bacillus pakistanensis]